MRFRVSGIRDIKDAAQNVSFLINAPEEAAVRDFCGKSSIVIFELKPFAESPQSFGKVILKVGFDKAVYDIITTFEKVGDAYMFFAPVQWDIKYINQLDHMMPDAEIPALLEKLDSEFEEIQRKTRPKKQTDDIGNVVLKNDPELEKMKRVTGQAISDIEQIHTKASSSFALRRLSELKDVEDELRKVRMGSNIPKMRSLVSDSYRIMEEIEMEYLDQQQVAEKALIANSTITHLDLVREYEKYEKAQKVKTGKLQKTPSDMYYIFFGKLGIYQRFLGKDINKKLEDRGKILYDSIDYMILFIIMCIVWLTISSLYQHYILSQPVFFFTFIDFGLIGILLVGINIFKKNNVKQIAVLFMGATLLFFILRYLIISNFAL